MTPQERNNLFDQHVKSIRDWQTKKLLLAELGRAYYLCKLYDAVENDQSIVDELLKQRIRGLTNTITQCMEYCEENVVQQSKSFVDYYNQLQSAAAAAGASQPSTSAASRPVSPPLVVRVSEIASGLGIHPPIKYLHREATSPFERAQVVAQAPKVPVVPTVRPTSRPVRVDKPSSSTLIQLPPTVNTADSSAQPLLKTKRRQKPEEQPLQFDGNENIILSFLPFDFVLPEIGLDVLEDFGITAEPLPTDQPETHPILANTAMQYEETQSANIGHQHQTAKPIISRPLEVYTEFPMPEFVQTLVHETVSPETLPPAKHFPLRTSASYNIRAIGSQQSRIKQVCPFLKLVSVCI
jgi:hypothetical protein